MSFFSNRKFKYLIVFLALAVMGIAILMSSAADSAQMAKGITDFNEMTASDFEVGRFVQGTIYELDDEFAYVEESDAVLGIKYNKRVGAHYYVMPLAMTTAEDSPYVQYVAVCIGNQSMAATAQKMCEETWAWWEDGTVPEEWTTLEITGKVSKLSGELEDFFYEWLMYGDESADRSEYAKYVAPYVITYYNTETANSPAFTLVAIAILIIGIAGGVIMGVIIKRESSELADVAAEVGRTPDFPEFPERSSAYGAPASGYNPVTGRTESVPTPSSPEVTEKPVPEKAPASFEMDSIEIPSLSDEDGALGIGIDDE